MPTTAQINSLIGIPYNRDGFDCADLAAKVQWDLFGRVIELPGHHPKGVRAQAAAIRRHAVVLAVPVAADQVIDGDAVLIVCQSAERGSLLHIGTILLICGARWVLHASAAIGHSVLQRVSDLAGYGLRIEGYYRWK